MPAFSIGQFGFFGIAAHREIGPELALAGLAVDCPGNFAVDQHDALVSTRHFGQKLLHHVRLAPGQVEHFHQGGQVFTFATDPENRLAAIAVERLDDDVAIAASENCVRQRASA